MTQAELSIGDIVQIEPDHDELFGGCLMIVTEPKSWGAQGVITAPDMRKGMVYYRCEWPHMTRVGHAEWLIGNGHEDDDE